MYSKEEKLKYGEILRQQIRQKQQRQRHGRMAKLGSLQQQPVQRVQSDRIVLADPSIVMMDQKEAFQGRLESQDYNPFGKAGGGAPNRKIQQNATLGTEGNYSGVLPNSRNFLRNQDDQYPQRQQFLPVYTGNEYPPANNNSSGKYPSNTAHPYQIPPLQQLRQQPPPQYFQRPQNYPYPPQQIQNQIPRNMTQNYQQEIPTRNIQPQYIEPIPQRSVPQYVPEQLQRGRIQQQRIPELPPTYHDMGPFSQASDPNIRIIDRERVKTIQNDQMQEMYKRGGRNLLKLQNETVNEHLVKQKQKNELQNFLRQQMQEAEMRKQLQKQKIKRQQLQEQRRNKEYIEMQNQKLRDEERKKNEQKQKIVDENLRNLAKRKQLEQEAKDKLQRQRVMHEQNARRREHQQRTKDRVVDRVVQQQRINEGAKSRLSRKDSSQSLSHTSSENTTNEKSFNTQITRQFFKKQREKEPEKFKNDKKLELFTNQIQKMRDQINNQGQMFHRQIERIKRQAELAQIQKKKAEFQIEKLKLQLQKKNKQSQLRLLQALKRNNPNNPPQKHSQPSYNPYQQQYDSLSQLQNEDHYRVPQQNKYVPPTPPKMTKNNKIQQYQVEPSYHAQKVSPKIPPKQSTKKLVDAQYIPRRFDQSQVMTLDTDSKKIPLNLPTNSKLTMSKIENYGKQSAFYHDIKPQPSKNYHHQSIKEQMEESRIQSRNSNRKGQVQELERLIGSKQGKRWNMSTVNDDITKEIEELLKKKDPKQYNNYQTSQISQAGRQNQSRSALPYDGNINTLSSNRISSVSNNGTLDVDKIHDRNQARLRQLKALGVETINTNNDDDLNRLNVLLRNYQ